MDSTARDCPRGYPATFSSQFVRSTVKIRRFALLAAAGCVLLPLPALAQQSTDIIRGRVTGPDTLPIAGRAHHRDVLPGRASPRSAQTDTNGRFQIIFVNGEGDYWIEVAKIGFNRRRFEIKKVGDEQVMLADARLASAVVAARRGQHHGRQPRARESQLAGTDVSGGDKALTTNIARRCQPDQAGNLAAMAATQPGIQRIPGMDGAADMFSAFGLSGDQNNTTFNGLGSGVELASARRPGARHLQPVSRRRRRAADSRARRSASSRSPDRTSRSAD